MWVAEGLLMYPAIDEVAATLRECAGALWCSLPLRSFFCVCGGGAFALCFGNMVGAGLPGAANQWSAHALH